MTIATIGNQPILGSSPARWTISSGVHPHLETFDVTPTSAQALQKFAESRSPVELLFQHKDKEIKIKNLWVLNISPGENPHIRRVTIADRRWFWPYTWIKKSFNIRRRSGFRRINATDNPSTNPVLFKWQYALWSLNGVVKWSP